MVRLDVWTLAFASAVLALAVTPIIAFIAGQRTRSRMGGQERLLFSAGAAAYGLGVLPIILWQGSPWALIIGNLLVMASACAVHAGVMVHRGRRPPLVAYGVGMAVVGAGFSLSLFAGVGGVAERIIIVSAARIPFLAHAALLLHGAPGRSNQVLKTGFIFFAALLGLRILDVAAVAPLISDFVSTLGIQAAYFSGVSVFLVLLGIFSVLTATEAEEAYLRDRIDTQTEALRQAKEVAEQALAAKSRFLAATGHDLRQAVHAMNMLLSAVTQELAEQPRGHADLTDLTRGMERIAATMSEQLTALLEIARLESGAVSPHPGPYPLRDLFEHLEGQYGHAAHAHNVDLRFIDTSAVVMTDPALLLRLTGNLVDNAIKFGRDGRVVVGCRHQGDMVILQVWDEGPGIAPAHMDAIFSDYHRLNAPAVEDTPGVGLGLAIGRRTAELLGHTLKVQSREGRGSVFSVALRTLPQAQLDV